MSTTGSGMVGTDSADQDTVRSTKTNRRNDGSSMQSDMNQKVRTVKKGDASMSSLISTTSPR